MYSPTDRLRSPGSLHALLFAAALIAAMAAHAADLHVRPVADCVHYGDGTVATCATADGAEGAFKGFQDIDWGMIQPGDTLYVIGRHVDALVIGKSGTAAQPIAIRGDMPGFAAGSIHGGDTLGICVGDANHNHLAFAKLEISHCLNRGLQLANDYTNGVRTSGVAIEDVYIHDIAGGGNWPTCIWGYGNDVLIRNARIENCGDDAIWWTGRNVSVLDNVIVDVGMGPQETGDCVQFGGWSTQFLIAGNFCDHSRANEKHCYIVAAPDASAYDATASGQVVDNTCLLPPDAGFDTKGIAVDAPNTLIARNFVTGGRFGIFSADAYIVANVVTQFSTRGINITAAPTTLRWPSQVMHNTVLAASAAGQAPPAYCIHGYDTSAEFANNIAVGCAVGYGGYGASSDDVWTHNVSWQHLKNYEFGATGTHTLTTPIDAMPQFIGNDPHDPSAWQVLLAIPAKDLTGYAAGNYGPMPLIVDFNANPRPVEPSAGAYEPDGQ